MDVEITNLSECGNKFIITQVAICDNNSPKTFKYLIKHELIVYLNKMIESGFDINTIDIDDIFVYACMNNKLDSVKWLYKNVKNSNFVLDNYDIFECDSKIIKYLFKKLLNSDRLSIIFKLPFFNNCNIVSKFIILDVPKRRGNKSISGYFVNIQNDKS